MAARVGLTVVKLGGSHAFAAQLRPWLAAIRCGGGRVVVVPGGGPFADTVRTAQAKMGFDDRAAHDMALLAMEQYGRALVAIEPRLVAADSDLEIRQILRDGHVPVWMAARMTAHAPDVPVSWDVTSDSLAAWLARRLGARRLVFIKHVDSLAVPVRLADLCADGIIDPMMPSFIEGGDFDLAIMGAADHEIAADAFARGKPAGCRIELR